MTAYLAALLARLARHRERWPRWPVTIVPPPASVRKLPR